MQIMMTAVVKVAIPRERTAQNLIEEWKAEIYDALDNAPFQLSEQAWDMLGSITFDYLEDL